MGVQRVLTPCIKVQFLLPFPIKKGVCKMSKYILDEGIETFEIEVKNRKKPIVIKFCPTDEKLVDRFKEFFDNVQNEITKLSNVKADYYGNGENPADNKLLEEFKQICIKEVDKLLDYEGNGKALFANCNPFRATKSGYWIEQVFYILAQIIKDNTEATLKDCELNLTARGKRYVAKYLK